MAVCTSANKPVSGKSLPILVAAAAIVSGFVRSDGLVPQRYLALLIGLGDTIAVEQLTMGEDQTAGWAVPLGREGWREAVLVLSGLAPLTSQPASYQLTIDAIDT